MHPLCNSCTRTLHALGLLASYACGRIKQFSTRLAFSSQGGSLVGGVSEYFLLLVYLAESYWSTLKLMESMRRWHWHWHLRKMRLSTVRSRGCFGKNKTHKAFLSQESVQAFGNRTLMEPVLKTQNNEFAILTKMLWTEPLTAASGKNLALNAPVPHYLGESSIQVRIPELLGQMDINKCLPRNAC